MAIASRSTSSPPPETERTGAPRQPAKAGLRLLVIRRAMYLATNKYLPGGRENPHYKPVTLRRPQS